MTAHAVFTEVSPLCRGLKYFSFFIHRDIFSINHPNTTPICNSMHYLKRPSTRIGKFALFVHFFWTPFFLGYSQGFEKCIYSLTPFHHFSFVISFPLAQLWLSATANLCKLVDVPVMVGDEPSFSGAVFRLIKASWANESTAKSRVHLLLTK